MKTEAIIWHKTLGKYYLFFFAFKKQTNKQKTVGRMYKELPKLNHKKIISPVKNGYKI